MDAKWVQNQIYVNLEHGKPGALSEHYRPYSAVFVRQNTGIERRSHLKFSARRA